MTLVLIICLLLMKCGFVSRITVLVIVIFKNSIDLLKNQVDYETPDDPSYIHFWIWLRSLIVIIVKL